MTTRQKIADLEPWDYSLADSMVSERDQWLDGALNVCVKGSRTRDEAVEWLAESMEDYLQNAIEELSNSTPRYIADAMDGFFQLEPNLDFRAIADALVEDSWPEGSAKPTVSKNAKGKATGSKNLRRQPSKKAPVRKTTARKAPVKKTTAKKTAARRY